MPDLRAKGRALVNEPDSSRTSTTRTTLSLPLDFRSVREARAFMRVRCQEAGTDAKLRDAATLLVSEVVTNALLHAGSSAHLAVTTNAHRVLVEVFDDSPRLPQEAVRGEEALNGRGLAIVDAVAKRWGALQSGPGKVVWFEVSDQT